MPSTDFSFSLQPERIASGEDGPACLALPYAARMLDSQSVAVQISGGSTSRVLPLPLVQILSQCNRLRRPNEHISQVIQALRAPESQRGEIRRGLDQLLEQGLLLSDAALLERMARSPAGPIAMASPFHAWTSAQYTKPKTTPMTTMSIRSFSSHRRALIAAGWGS